MNEETIKYSIGPAQFIGKLYNNAKPGKRSPAVIVAHTWHGQDDFVKEQAKNLADLGYVGFAADVFGNAITTVSNDIAAEWIHPLFIDRKMLQDRILAAYQVVKMHPAVDPNKIGAIGFCFGGLTVIELYRSGVDLKGVVSFHGLLGPKLGDWTAKTVPIKKPKGALLFLHGYKDLMVSTDDILNFQKEMDGIGANWQMNIFGQATHAFTNPEANQPEKGMQFHALTAKRAFIEMQNFFTEVFS